MKKIIYKLIAIGILGGLIGCATQNESVWFKSGASAQEFEMDRGQCNAQAFSLANGNIYQIAIIQNQCLQGKGWQIKNSKHIANANLNLNNAREKARKDAEERCSIPEFAVIYIKTPCFSDQIDFKHMADETTITADQKQVFVKWREDVDKSYEKDNEIEIRLNENVGKKIVDRFQSIFKPESDKNNLDLYTGNITWGQYNRRRKEIYLKFIDSLK
jgi:hypothetical protein